MNLFKFFNNGLPIVLKFLSPTFLRKPWAVAAAAGGVCWRRCWGGGPVAGGEWWQTYGLSFHSWGNCVIFNEQS